MKKRVLDTGWQPKVFSKLGDLERRLTIPNPVEPMFPIEIKLDLYQLESEEDPERRWRCHAHFDKHEFCRLYAKTSKEAKARMEAGVTAFFGSISKAVESPKAVELKKAEQKVLDEVRFLVKSGYDGPFMGEDIEPLFKAVIELEGKS